MFRGGRAFLFAWESWGWKKYAFLLKYTKWGGIGVFKSCVSFLSKCMGHFGWGEARGCWGPKYGHFCPFFAGVEEGCPPCPPPPTHTQRKAMVIYLRSKVNIFATDIPSCRRTFPKARSRYFAMDWNPFHSPSPSIPNALAPGLQPSLAWLIAAGRFHSAAWLSSLCVKKWMHKMIV